MSSSHRVAVLLKNLFYFFTIAVNLTLVSLHAKDWPIYKGNIYFTGNNDEIIVKNNKLKWAFIAKHKIKNPVVYDGKILFLDTYKNIYCLNQNGKLIFKLSLNKIASRFRDGARIKGKIKYPIIKDGILYITDSVAIYAISLKKAKVIWARTALIKSSYTKRKRYRPKRHGNQRKYSKYKSRQYKSRYKYNRYRRGNYRVASIYSDPAINNHVIFYGARQTFIARRTHDGKEIWRNENIHSFSGFPSFYDKYILTLSANYLKRQFHVIKMNAETGVEIWRSPITKPFKLFSPLVFKSKVYISTNKTLTALDLETGKPLWQKNYGQIITSNLSFSENKIIFTLNNNKVIQADVKNGKLKQSYDFGDQSAPYFVVTRDQFYTAYQNKKNKIIYAKVQALGFDKDDLWEFQAICPGPPSQPVSAKGTLYVPAGKILYALGHNHSDKLGTFSNENCDSFKKKWELLNKKRNQVQPKKEKQREFDYQLNNFSDKQFEFEYQIYKNEELIRKGKKIYSEKNGKLTIPDISNSQTVVYFHHNNYITKKVKINKTQKDITVKMQKIETGKVYNINNINFATASSHLLQNSIPLLNKLAITLRSKKNLILHITGHTDNIGKQEYNKKLSQRRAQAVASYLVKNGISPRRVTATGLGQSKPIASNKTKTGRAKNRRTEFIFLYQ